MASIIQSCLCTCNTVRIGLGCEKACKKGTAVVLAAAVSNLCVSNLPANVSSELAVTYWAARTLTVRLEMGESYTR